MLLKAAALWAFTSTLIAQSVDFTAAKIPFFTYPPLALIARIQGKVDLQLVVEKGKVISVNPPSGLKEFRIPQLSVPAVEVAKRFEFHPSMSGDLQPKIDIIGSLQRIELSLDERIKSLTTENRAAEITPLKVRQAALKARLTLPS